MKVYIGFDSNEPRAVEKAYHSLLRTSGVHAELLVQDRLRAAGLFTRPIDTRNGRYDLHSNAPASTDFALTRFLVPIICQTQWALFTDCDVVFFRDVHEIMRHADESKAVWVVKHQMPDEPESVKMVNARQVSYARKNWSSVILWNTKHRANARLSLNDVNTRRGIDLHQFYWLNEDEIGELPPEWNWLVNVEPKPDNLAIGHWTLGGPFNAGWQGAEYDQLWLDS